MIIALLLWLIALTVWGLYFQFRGNHHRAIANNNAQVLSEMQGVLNYNADLCRRNFVKIQRRLDEQETNIRNVIAVGNANDEITMGGFEVLHVRTRVLKHRIDCLKSSTSQRFDSLRGKLLDTVAFASSVRDEASHDINAVDARVTLVAEGLNERLGEALIRLRRVEHELAIRSLPDTSASVEEFLETTGALGFGPGRLGSLQQAAAGEMLDLSKCPQGSTVNVDYTSGEPVVTHYPDVIHTPHGPAWNNQKMGWVGFLQMARPDFYVRPNPDGKPGNMYFDRHGNEISEAVANGREPYAPPVTGKAPWMSSGLDPALNSGGSEDAVGGANAEISRAAEPCVRDGTYPS